MFKWKYNAVIYSKSTGEILANKWFDTPEGAECFIEQNMEQFYDDIYSPTGHVTKDYVFVSE